MTQRLSPVKTVTTYKQEIDDALQRLDGLSNAYFNINPKDIDWGDVGYVERIAELIAHATDFAFQEGQCANTGGHHETIN